VSARSAGQNEGRKLAGLWLELPARERLVRMRDRAAEKSDDPAYYLGMLEGLVGAIGPAPDAPTVRRNPAASYEEFFWGRPPESETRAEHHGDVKPGERLIVMGPLISLVYRAKKGDERKANWEHPFEHPRPLLTYKQNGSLIITGGAYRVTARGIVG
jgi:hypothetical protein